MSSIPTKQIDGDVSIGRNVNIGGKADIKGSASVGHNLKVEGWLDAKNIKSPCKGVFTTIESLKEAYPDGTLPEGSWAIVGGTLPGELWSVKNGKWIDSGETAGSFTADVAEVQAQADACIAEIQKSSDHIQSLVNALPVAQETGDSTTSVMSQKAVTDAISAHKSVEVVNDLTTGGTEKALSAEQGKLMGEELETRVNHHVVSNNKALNQYIRSLYIPDLAESDLATYTYVRIVDRHVASSTSGYKDSDDNFYTSDVVTIDSDGKVWLTSGLVKVTKEALTSGTLVSDTATTLYYKTSELTKELSTTDSTTWTDSSSNSYTDKTKIFTANSKYYLVDGLTSYTADSLYIDAGGTEYVANMVTAATVNGIASTDTYYTGNTSTLSTATKRTYATGIELGTSNTSFTKSYLNTVVSISERASISQDGLIKTDNGAYMDLCWPKINTAEDADGYVVLGATLDNCVFQRNASLVLNELIDYKTNHINYTYEKIIYTYKDFTWAKGSLSSKGANTGFKNDYTESYIEIEHSSCIFIKGNYSNYSIFIYDDNKNYINKYTNSLPTYLPSKAAYLRISIENNNWRASNLFSDSFKIVTYTKSDRFAILNNVLAHKDIADNIIEDNSNKVLSARQGFKYLNFYENVSYTQKKDTGLIVTDLNETTGQPKISSSNLCSDYIEVDPNYFILTNNAPSLYNISVFCYDSDKTFIGISKCNNGENSMLPYNTRYVRLRLAGISSWVTTLQSSIDYIIDTHKIYTTLNLWSFYSTMKQTVDRLSFIDNSISLKYRFIVASFGYSEEKLMLLGTNDLINWDHIVTIPVGTTYGSKYKVRDPSIILSGKYFYIVHSIVQGGWYSGVGKFSLIRSKNLFEWEQAAVIQCIDADGNNIEPTKTWAPALCLVDGEYYIVINLDNKPYIYKIDLKSYSLTYVAQPTITDEPSTIDSHLYKIDGVYYLIGITSYVDPNYSKMYIAKSDTIAGPYTKVSLNISIQAEGEFLMKMDDGRYILFMQKSWDTNKPMVYSICSSGVEGTWSEPKEVSYDSDDIKSLQPSHATILDLWDRKTGYNL